MTNLLMFWFTVWYTLCTIGFMNLFLLFAKESNENDSVKRFVAAVSAVIWPVSLMVIGLITVHCILMKYRKC